MVSIKLKIGDLFNFISFYERIQFKINIFYNQKLHLKIKNERNKWINIVSLITKKSKIRKIIFDNNSFIKIADNHLICYDKINCKLAKNFIKGDIIITSTNSKLKVISNNLLNNIEEIVYDLTVDSDTHLYQDANGIIHHNTSEAICTFSQWYLDEKVDRIFIISRPGISYHWKTEILLVSTLFTEDDILIVDNKNKKLLFDNCEDKKIIIIPNHLLKPVFLSYKKGQDLNKSAKKVRWKTYVNIKEKLNTNKLGLVIDEAHELNNSQAVSTKAILNHIDFFDYRICLSATPHGNRLERYYNCMQLIDKGALRFSELSFKLFISKENGTKYDPYAIVEYDEDKIRNLKEKVLSLYFIKRVKEDLPEMKYEKIIKPIYFKLSDKHLKLYQEFIQYEVDKIEEDKGEINLKTILQKFPYLIMMLENPFLLQGRVISEPINKLLDKWKLQYDERFNLLDILINKYVKEDGEKIIVADNHPLTLDQLSTVYKDYNPLVMHGGIHLDEKGKNNIQNLYNDRNNDHRILFMNPSVGGTGVNFNKGGKRIIVYTVPNDAVLLEQLMNRCHRINNTEDAIIEFLLADKSLDILRYTKNMGRMKLNEQFITKNLDKKELKKLLQMSIGDKNYG